MSQFPTKSYAFCCNSRPPPRTYSLIIDNFHIMPKIPPGLFFLKCRTNLQRYKIHWQIYIWLITYLFYVASHSARKPLSIVKNVLRTTNSCTGWAPFNGHDQETLLGGLDSGFLFSYGVFMLFFAYMAEKIGLMRVLIVTNLFASLFTVLFGVGYFVRIHNYWFYFFVQFFCGVSMSASWPCLMGVFGNWSGIKFRGLIAGIWASNASVGNIVGTLIACAFVNFSWGWSFVVPGLVLLGITIINFLFLLERPELAGIEITKSESTQMIPEEHLEDTSEHISLLNLLRIPSLISFAITTFFLKLTSYTLLYWLPVYLLTKSQGTLNFQQSGQMSAFYDVGSVIGMTIGGLVTDFLGQRLVVCLLMATLACPTMFLLNFYEHTSFVFFSGMLVLIGFFVNGSFGILVTTISIDLSYEPSVRKLGRGGAAITGFLDGVGSLGAAVGPILSGYLSSYSWSYFFYLIIGSVGVCVLFLIKPTVMEFRNRVPSS